MSRLASPAGPGSSPVYRGARVNSSNLGLQRISRISMLSNGGRIGMRNGTGGSPTVDSYAPKPGGRNPPKRFRQALPAEALCLHRRCPRVPSTNAVEPTRSDLSPSVHPRVHPPQHVGARESSSRVSLGCTASLEQLRARSGETIAVSVPLDTAPTVAPLDARKPCALGHRNEALPFRLRTLACSPARGPANEPFLYPGNRIAISVDNHVEAPSR